MKKKTKNFKKIEKKYFLKKYTIAEAIKILKKINFLKFDPTVEISYNLFVDKKLKNFQIKDSVILPHGSGKKQKILVISDNKNIKKDLSYYIEKKYFGHKKILKKIKNGWLNFDIIVTSPNMMKDISTIGYLLGPKGLMPNLKLGTITNNIVGTVKDIKNGKIFFSSDKNNNINSVIGKLSFKNKFLIDNFLKINNKILSLILLNKKKVIIKNLVLSTTMSPGIKILF